LAIPIPACTPTDAESFALPDTEKAPDVQTLEPCWESEAWLSSKPAAMLATVVLATLIVIAFSLPLMWTPALTGTVA
jgi:fatty acid desaturase